jgi:glycosyltransferase involved in cell wall biosynthesis
MRRVQTALVLWAGVLGGAETMTGELALALREHGVDSTIAFVTSAGALGERLDRTGVPHRSLGLRRGSLILRHPRAYARFVTAAGADSTLLMSPGYMAFALRAGGYGGRIAAVEHGALLRQRAAAEPRRSAIRAARAVGARFTDVEIAVSEFMLAELVKGPHARDVRCVPNGVDTGDYAPRSDVLAPGRAPVVGWAGRMVPGKGVEDLIRAVAALRGRGLDVRARLAGDGPHEPVLRELASAEGVADRVEFAGRVQDMPGFWNGCDVGVALSHGLTESFGRSTLEAAACGRPVIVTRNGGLVDLVEDGRTGHVVAPGDPVAVAAALEAILADADRGRRFGERGRRRAVDRFSMAATAAGYAAALRGP